MLPMQLGDVYETYADTSRLKNDYDYEPSIKSELEFQNLLIGLEIIIINEKNIKISVIGLGYVGLPLAVEFSKKYRVIGFDINKERVSNLKIGIDETNEVDHNELRKSQNITNKKGLLVTDKVDNIQTCNIHIITVPTPVDENFDPDLKPIKSATKMIANILKKDDIVIYETTVYPGLTEEICIPILEKISGFKYNSDFFAGYSPRELIREIKENTNKNC